MKKAEKEGLINLHRSPGAFSAIFLQESPEWQQFRHRLLTKTMFHMLVYNPSQRRYKGLPSLEDLPATNVLKENRSGIYSCNWHVQ